MGNFKREDGRRFNRDRVMHQVVCDQCGKPCEVPFRPTGDKPVYCSSCFEGKRKTRGAGDRFSKNKFSRQKTDFGSKGNNDELKKQLVILNGKMDQLIKAVEAMANTKTIEKKAIKKTRTVKDKKSAKKVVKKAKKVVKKKKN